MLYCDDCRFLNTTEEYQNWERDRQRLGGNHRCEYYHIILKHENQHPHIVRLKTCSVYEKEKDK